jgi:hypothetical protein
MPTQRKPLSLRALCGRTIGLSAAAALLAVTLAGADVIVGPGGDAQIWNGAVNTSWHNSGNWTNNQTPTNGDGVIIDNGPTNVWLFADTANVASLYIGGAKVLTNNAHKINVTDSDGATTITGATSRIFLNAMAGNAVGFETNTLSIESSGELAMAGGRALINEQLTLSSNGRISGFGLIEIDSAALVPFNGLAGEEIYPQYGDLTIDVTGGGSIVLPPTVNIVDTGSSLTVNGPFFLDINDINLAEDNAFSTSDEWTLSGVMNKSGAIATSATVSGGDITVEGVVDVDAGALNIDSSVAFTPGSEIQVGGNFTALNINGPHTAVAGALASVGTNGVLRINGQQELGQTWQGNIDLSAATLEVNGPQLVAWRFGGTLEFGSVFGLRSRLSGDAMVRASGDVSLPGLGGIVDSALDLMSTGTMHLAQPTTRLIVTGDLVQRNGAPITGDGAIQIADTGVFLSVAPSTLDVDVINAGVFETDGIFTDAGYRYINGSYMQTATGRLNVQIAGPTPGERDVYETSLDATFAGEISVELVGGYEPIAGDEFTVFTANSGINGAFDALVGDAGFEVSYLGNTVVLTYVGVEACPADLNGDGVVDGMDLAAILANWGGVGDTDLNGDGVTDGPDLAALLAAWGGCL